VVVPDDQPGGGTTLRPRPHWSLAVAGLGGQPGREDEIQGMEEQSGHELAFLFIEL
jgi:hypothetical protein